MIQIHNSTQLKVKEQHFVAVLHFTVTAGSSIMDITFTLIWVRNSPKFYFTVDIKV
jgi:hypothetical protein